MAKKQVSKARKDAMTAYQKKHKMQGPLTEQQENAAYEEDMRRRSGAKDPNDPKNWRRTPTAAKPKAKKKAPSPGGYGAKRKQPKVR
jgi:hypothetical protein